MSVANESMSLDRCHEWTRGKGSECRRRSIQTGGRCLFHHGSRNQEQEQLFAERLREEIERLAADAQAPVIDLSGFVFPPNLRMRDVVGVFTKPVVFEHAVFELGVDFSECEFQADVDFFGSTFRGAEGYVACANFASCRFGAEASFWAAKFQGGSDSNSGAAFNKAVFNGPARFNAASFDHWATFADARFQSKAAFADATFKGRTDFSSVTFAAEADFTGTSLAEADFSKAVFSDDAHFIETRLPANARPDPESVTLVRAVFFRDVRFLKPERVQFRGLAGAPIDLRNVSFLSTDVERVVFVDELWRSARHTLRRSEVLDEDLVEPSGRYADHALRSSLPTYGKVKQLYRRLRKNYEAAGRYAEAGDFFVGEMEMQRLDVGATHATWRWCARNLSLLALYKYVALYGESYRRLFSWGAVLIVAFAALRLQRVPSPGQLDVAIALGRSVAAFFQLPVTNTGLDVTERLLSAPILGLLLVSLKRTFERK